MLEEHFIQKAWELGVSSLLFFMLIHGLVFQNQDSHQIRIPILDLRHGFSSKPPSNRGSSRILGASDLLLGASCIIFLFFPCRSTGTAWEYKSIKSEPSMCPLLTVNLPRIGLITRSRSVWYSLGCLKHTIISSATQSRRLEFSSTLSGFLRGFHSGRNLGADNGRREETSFLLSADPCCALIRQHPCFRYCPEKRLLS